MTKSLPTFHVTLAADLFSFFVPLLQQGVFVSAKAGGNIKSFLCERLGISPEYAEKRIQTVFADGQVVDDWNRTVLANGSTLALSAAAPGLAGAILRRQGPLSTMRRPITYELAAAPSHGASLRQCCSRDRRNDHAEALQSPRRRTRSPRSGKGDSASR